MTRKEQFDKFIISHLEDAYRFTRIYIKNDQDVEDVVSDSIEKALRKIHTLKDPDMMKTWFFRIIINTSISHLRKQTKTVLLSEEIPLYYIDDFSQLEFDDLLSMLSDSDRKIVSLRFRDNCELKEIAEILGMNENTIKTRLYRALKKLRMEISDEGDSLTVKNAKNKSTVKSFMVLLIAILFSSVCIFNLFPSLTATAYDIPVIGKIVRIITFNRFEYKDGGYEAEILVPKIQGLLDVELQDRLNAEFSEYADDLIRSFEATILEAEELGDESVQMSIKADYAVKTDNERILSLDTWLYSDINGFVLHKFYTIDKEARRQLNLSDLFVPGVDYITPISTYIAGEMKRINDEEDGLFDLEDSPFGGFTEIKADQNFYINEDGSLVICFDKYEVAAGAQGSPEFVIPYDKINDISSSDLIR